MKKMKQEIKEWMDYNDLTLSDIGVDQVESLAELDDADILQSIYDDMLDEGWNGGNNK